MTERDPLDDLREAAEMPLDPSRTFADQLLIDLLDSGELTASNNDNLTLLEITERDTPMGNNMKWLWTAAAAVLLVILGTVFVVNRSDGSSVVTEEPANTTIPDVVDEDEQSAEETTTTTTTAPSTSVTDSVGESELLAIGDQFLDAFYSGDATAMTGMSVEDAPLSSVLYVQAFAAAANTTVVERSCEVTGEFGVRCTARTEDDIFRSLGSQHVEGFVVRIVDGKIEQVSRSVEDPQTWDDLISWVISEYPETLTGPCDGVYTGGGQTPADCAVTLSTLVEEFVETDLYVAP